MKDVHQLHGTGRDSERQPATIGDRDRHAETPWDRRDIKRQSANIGDSERHAATPQDWRETVRESY